jgi:type I restriction enzyme, S subunit
MKLGEIADFINGRAFKPEDWSEDGIPIIRIQNLNNHSKPFNHYSGEFSDKHFVKNGDVLLSWSGTPGTSFGCFPWNRGDGVLNQHIFNVKINENICSKDYFIRAVNKNLNLLIDQAHGGVGLQHITKRKLVEIDIPLPPLEEQKQITIILDAADVLLQKDKDLITKYEELTQSLFLDMFGDPFDMENLHQKVEFESLTNRITYGFTKPMKHLGEGIPIITAKNVQNGYIDFQKVHYADLLEFQELTAKSKPDKHDILITKDGSIGRTALNDSNAQFCINQSVTLVKPKHDLINPTYLVAYLLSTPVQRKIQGMGKGGGLKHLQITELAKFPTVKPSLKLQNDFAKSVKSIQTQKALAQQSLIQSEKLFNSILQKAFKGDLTN